MSKKTAVLAVSLETPVTLYDLVGVVQTTLQGIEHTTLRLKVRKNRLEFVKASRMCDPCPDDGSMSLQTTSLSWLTYRLPHRLSSLCYEARRNFPGVNFQEVVVSLRKTARYKNYLSLTVR